MIQLPLQHVPLLRRAYPQLFEGDEFQFIGRPDIWVVLCLLPELIIVKPSGAPGTKEEFIEGYDRDFLSGIKCEPWKP